tara:strand:- start:555 stop:1007 length:453 start_codon:yes stop_codon:yes gene_type:complete
MRLAVLASTALAFLAFAVTAHAADPVVIGQVKTVTAPTHIERDGDSLAAAVGSAVYQSDVIVTGAGGSVGITFKDNSLFSAGPDSRIALEQFRFDSSKMSGNFLASVEKGTLSVDSGDIARGSPDAMKIKTPSAILAVRGTAFLIKVGEN